jgi:hypothetical protein
MNIRIVTFRPSLSTLCLALGMLLCPLSGLTDEPEHTIAEPGFRPESNYAAAFLDTVGTAKIAVLPTLVRRTSRTAHSFSSQQQIVEFLTESAIATAVSQPQRIDLGPLRRRSQWEIFEYGTRSIQEKLEGFATDADYVLVMEILVPNEQAVFGIEIYIVDQQGRSSFSFLLNSHHRLFADAKLFAKNTSEASRNKMIEDATRVGLMALKAQIGQARECMTERATRTTRRIEPGILYDFQSELASSTSRYGIPLGFSTFSDGSSSVNVSRTDSHPDLAEEAKGNWVLQLDLDVSGWAGLLYRNPDDGRNTWAAQDWGGLTGFSLWFYGSNSGTEMFIDILDNRSPCSRRDDAERFTYIFWDDVPGWRLLSVPFKDMARKEIYNAAPSDGLTLTEVHGWALGSLNTEGPRTYYIDNFQLWSDSPVGKSKSLAVLTHEQFTETRIDDHSSRIVTKPGRQQGLAVEKAMSLQCAIAKLTTARSYSYFRIDERARLSDERGSFRVTFYASPPKGIPVLDNLQGEDLPAEPVLMTAVLNAEEIVAACIMMENRSKSQSRPH